MRYTHMHGCGNSFYVIDARDSAIADQAALDLVRRNCGDPFDLDGVVMIHPSSVASIRTVIYNSDGSRAPMCGNGVRCLSKFVIDHTPEATDHLFGPVSVGQLSRAMPRLGLPNQVSRVLLKSILQTNWCVDDKVVLGRLIAETDSGLKTHYCLSQNGAMIWATVSLAPAELCLARLNCTLEGAEALDREICVGGQCYDVSVIGLGNLHCVVFVDDLNGIDVGVQGRAIETCDRIFPDSVNVHFVQVLAPNHLKIRSWERGAGATLACGTGSCASVVAGLRTGRCAASVRVDQPGGAIHVDVGDDVLMSGPAVTVCEGEWADAKAVGNDG